MTMPPSSHKNIPNNHTTIQNSTTTYTPYPNLLLHSKRHMKRLLSPRNNQLACWILSMKCRCIVTIRGSSSTLTRICKWHKTKIVPEKLGRTNSAARRDTLKAERGQPKLILEGGEVGGSGEDGFSTSEQTRTQLPFRRQSQSSLHYRVRRQEECGVHELL